MNTVEQSSAPSPGPPPFEPNSPPRAATPAGDVYAPIDPALGQVGFIDALLKSPGRVAYSLRCDASAHARVRMLIITCIGMLIYGLFMGMFSGGVQLLVVPLKACAGMLLAAIICFPSLYIFGCLSGGDQSVGETWGFLLMVIALTATLLVGLAPVSWVFSQSTHSTFFMGTMHTTFLAVGLYHGLRVMRRSLSLMTGCGMGTLKVWSLIFVTVLLQMSTTLRPLVGPAAPFQSEKRFFLSYWGDVLTADEVPSRRPVR